MDFTGVCSGVVLVTGGGSGIGQATAVAFCKNGVTRFALLDLNPEGLEKTVQKLQAVNRKVDVQVYPTNVVQEDEVIQSIDKAHKYFGRFDYVVQSAGLSQRPRALLHDTEMVNYDRVFNVNTRGLYIVQRETVRRMRGQSTPEHGQKGSIVNLASMCGIQTSPDLVPYAASKAAVIALTQGDSQAYAAEGIRINCICPGVVMTPMNQASIAAGADFSVMLNGTPANRTAEPEEIAWSLLFLSHPNSSYIVGHALVQDGGTTLT